ncbi:MAG: choline dehydrogenase [Gammaproteobacteria bacterium]|nr:choline dehydrogenase [Gammaproteobacteria bacterium]
MRDEGSYDYIIVGAGSAGCVLAHRLGENPGLRILLLEAGGSDNATIIKMPAALSIPMNTTRFNWGFKTEPEPHLDGRIMNLPRGKGLGGSSSINGMCYVRGNPMDYERWKFLGATGWGWNNVLPYFERVENVKGGGVQRGTDGPLSVTHGPETNPLYRAFIEAGRQAGYAVSDNMNDVQHEGFGPMEMTVRDGRRCSAAVAYLHPAIARGNVRVVTQAHVRRIITEGRKATGVEFLRGGRPCVARTRGEVILSAGSIMSPIVLKRSGIGPAAELRACDIDVVHDLPGVGENLMDHLELYVQQECIQPISLYGSMGLVGKALIGARWLLRHDGLGASNHFESGAHIRSRAGIVYPDIQFHMLPLAISYDGQTLAQGHGYQVHVGTKRSKSRGWVRLSPSEPMAAPRVCFNYMSHRDDWLEMRACVGLTREIFAQPAFDRFRGRELTPGADCVSDEAIDGFIKQKVESAYHPCGTCRMGSDAQAVVSPECRVNGIESLRVVDSSIMPQATAGDLNAPTIMLAERAADLIAGKKMLTSETAALPVDPDWETGQRSAQISLDLSRQDQSSDDVFLREEQFSANWPA